MEEETQIDAQTENHEVEFDDSIRSTPFGSVKPVRIVQEMQRSYLDYAMSVIVSRALPDVRDGLKPVHRRILFAMKELGLNHSSSYKKCARIVGEVLGKYHPHGDTAVYDALVRLAQTFNMRYPLIEGQGNFGSIDGDSAAAMRYTEAKLAKITQELLLDLDKNTVDFADNFDGSEQEPTVLPANVPNLLLMGGDGIAVGMATKIPPHHLGEVIDATIALIQSGQDSQEVSPEIDRKEIENIDSHLLVGKFNFTADVNTLLKYINGPDFPTGAIMYDWEAISEVYKNGKGRILQRAVTQIEENNKGRYQIIITQLPYQVNKAKLVAKIADLVRQKKVDGIADLRDESDRDGLRVVVDLKKDSRPKSVLNNLFKFTELQTTFPANMVALSSDGTPHLMTLKAILTEYVEHRQLVIVRKIQFELIAAKARAHILEGLLIALANLDEVIKTIRNSKDADQARTSLMEKFKLSEIQATAILDMQLRKLAALERQKIEDEYKALMEKIDFMIDLLLSPQRILDTIVSDLLEVKEKYNDKRRTKLIKGKVGEFNEEDLIAPEEIIITMTASGYIKRLPINTYKSQRRGGVGVTGMTTKAEDIVSKILTANTHDHMMIFTNRGRVFKLKVYEIPEASRQAKGTSIINLIGIDQGELVQSIITYSPALVEGKNGFVTLATSKGLVKKTSLANFSNIRTNGIIAIGLKDGDELVWGNVTTGDRDILIITHKGQSIRFEEAQVRATARDTQGVRGITLSKDDYVVAVESIDHNPPAPEDKRRRFFNDLLVITERGYGKRTNVREYPVQNRGGKGVKVASLSTKTGDIAAARFVDQTMEQILITTQTGQIIKLPMKNIPQLKRPTQGVILMRFTKKDDKVVGAAALLTEENESEEAAA